MAAFGLFFVILGAGQWINGAGWGKYSLLFGLLWLVRRAVPVVPRGHPRERRRPVQPQDRPLVPLEHELVHLLGGDVLRRLLHRAVVDARRTRCRRSAASTTRCCGPTSRPCGRASPAGATASPAGIVEPFQTMGPFWLPTINTALLLTSGVTLTIAHHALRERPPRPRRSLFMWLTVLLGVDLPVRAGLRVLPCLPRPEPQAQLRRLRLDLLHADRLPRLPRVRRHADAAVHHAAPA